MLSGPSERGGAEEMKKVARAAGRAILFFVAALAGGVATTFVEVYVLGHVSKDHTAEWHFHSGVWVHMVMAGIAGLIFFSGFLLGSRGRTGESALWPVALLGLLYPTPLTLASLFTWGRTEPVTVAILVMLFAYIFFAPLSAGRRVGVASSPVRSPGMSSG